MATKTADKKGGEATEAPQTDSPLLDLSDAAVKRMIKLAKKRGFVTHEELNEVLPSEEVTSDQIEDIFAMLNEMGINVVEQEEAEAEQQGDHSSPASRSAQHGTVTGDLLGGRPTPLASHGKIAQEGPLCG